MEDKEITYSMLPASVEEGYLLGLLSQYVEMFRTFSVPITQLPREFYDVVLALALKRTNLTHQEILSMDLQYLFVTVIPRIIEGVNIGDAAKYNFETSFGRLLDEELQAKIASL